MTDKPLYAPGCFGEISTFSDDEICLACPFNVDCGSAHRRALAQFREFYGITVKEPKRQAGDLPTKVLKLFESLGKSVEEVKSAMMTGVNPYSVKDTFVGVVCHVLLRTGQSTRAFLATVLEDHKGYNAATADVYVRHTLQILNHCGVIEQNGDQIKLIRG